MLNNEFNELNKLNQLSQFKQFNELNQLNQFSPIVQRGSMSIASRSRVLALRPRADLNRDCWIQGPECQPLHHGAADVPRDCSRHSQYKVRAATPTGLCTFGRPLLRALGTAKQLQVGGAERATLNWFKRFHWCMIVGLVNQFIGD